MWIRSQNGEEILKVERFRLLPLDNGDCKVLAKLPRETVELGTYSADQAENIWLDLWLIVRMDHPYRTSTNYYTMPKRREEEGK